MKRLFCLSYLLTKYMIIIQSNISTFTGIYIQVCWLGVLHQSVQLERLPSRKSIYYISFLGMSGMEKTLLRTAQNEGHVCPRRGKASTWAEGTPRWYILRGNVPRKCTHAKLIHVSRLYAKNVVVKPERKRGSIKLVRVYGTAYMFVHNKR